MDRKEIKPHWWTRWRLTQFIGIVIDLQWRAFLRGGSLKECFILVKIAWKLTYGSDAQAIEGGE